MNITKKTYIATTIAIIAVIAAATTTLYDVAYAAHGLIHITKHGTNSYTISDQMSSVGSFDTTYKVVGERSDIREAEDLIISTVTSDFNSSAIVGYVTTDDNATTTMDTVNATTTDTTAGLPSPFATPEQINERITNELRNAITEAENNTAEGQYVEIKCDFGMSLEDMRCHYVPIPQAGQG